VVAAGGGASVRAAVARHPNPDVVVLDPRFRYKLGNTPILRLHRGTMRAEGPAWNGVGR
jgi:gluconolactonase